MEYILSAKNVIKDALLQDIMKLFKHQQKIINDDPKKCGLFLGCGGGKTITSLSLAEGNTIAITKKDVVLDGVFEKEYKNIKGNTKITNLTILSKEQWKKKYLNGEFDNVKFDTIIVDEVHHGFASIACQGKWRKSVHLAKGSQLFECLYNFLREQNPKRLYLLTGTPTKSLMSVFAILVLLEKYPITRWKDWRDEYYIERQMSNHIKFWIPKNDLKHKLKIKNHLKSVGYLGRLQDWFDVPKQTFVIKTFELSEEQRDMIGQVEIEYADNKMGLVQKSHQIANAILLDDKGELAWSLGYKKDDKLQFIEDTGLQYDKIIVACRWKKQIERYKNYFKKDRKCFEISGDHKDNFSEIKKSKRCYVFVNCQCAEGYELPDFPIMIFASNYYSYTNRNQMESRILRGNNLKKNLYIDLISGKIDLAIKKCLDNKQDFHEKSYERN